MCYKFAEENLSWNEAQANCESENGHLATVNSRYVLLLVTVFIYLFFVVYFDYVFKEAFIFTSSFEIISTLV